MKLETIDIHERMKHYHVPGISIAFIVDGVLHPTECFGVREAGTNKKVTDSTKFNACSISKLATTMLVLRLIEQGTLDLDENVNDRLVSWKVPENEYTQHKKVTLRKLLTHQAGFIDPDGSFSEYDSAQGIPLMVDLLQGKTSYCPEAVTVKNEPGSSFTYSDAGFCIIEQLIQDVTEKSFSQVMNELLFEPLQMNNSTLELINPIPSSKNDACGHHKTGLVVAGRYPTYPYPAAAGLWSTPSDLALLVSEISNSIHDIGKLGISKGLIKEMMTPQGCSLWTGFGVFLSNSGHELEISSLGWGVGFQSILVAYPFIGTGAVIMTNADLGVHQMKGIIGEIITTITPQLCHLSK